MHSHPPLIIGAGPAGLAAGIQLSRYGLQPLVFEREASGGLLRNANLVENYPGFPRGIPGAALARLIARQAERAGVVVTRAEVCRLDFAGGLFHAQTSAGAFSAPVAVIASGTQPRPLPAPEIPASLRRRVFYEVYPIRDIAGKHVAIIGAGDAAFDYALNLARRNHVTILMRGSGPKCLPLLAERAAVNERISVRDQAALAGLDETSEGALRLQCQDSGGGFSLTVDFFLVAIGRDPALGFLQPALFDTIEPLEQQGALYRIGDVKNGLYRQASIAAGEGVLAAMKIFERWKELRR